MFRVITTDACNCDHALNITDEHNAGTLFITYLLKLERFQLHFNDKHIINVYSGNDSIMHKFFGVKHA